MVVGEHGPGLHLGALDDLFGQVLVLCASAGLVKLGRIALDGTKLDALASKHKAMSHDRLSWRIPEVEAEVAKLLARGGRSHIPTTPKPELAAYVSMPAANIGAPSPKTRPAVARRLRTKKGRADYARRKASSSQCSDR